MKAFDRKITLKDIKKRKYKDWGKVRDEQIQSFTGVI